MNPTSGFRLFRVAGITVFLHWSWLLVATYEIQSRASEYSSVNWNIAEYVGLFAIVLMHEFCHALACRSVGGRAERIVLWPLGGVAYVSPPPRPGAYLWSIVAGPLLNVALLPVFYFLVRVPTGLELKQLIMTLGYVNLGLLLFNILPIYPLDGGQILRGLLWYVIGPIRSLTVSSIIGIIGAVLLGLLALQIGSVWGGVLALFVAMNSLTGFKRAKALRRRAEAPRHQGLACPSCGAAPPAGPYWACPNCRVAFDSFDEPRVCPQCGRPHKFTLCLDCGTRSKPEDWGQAPAAGSGVAVPPTV